MVVGFFVYICHVMQDKIRIEVIELTKLTGQSFYKFNIDTREIQLIASKKNWIIITPEPRMLYAPAINEQNAVKKFKKQVHYIMSKQK